MMTEPIKLTQYSKGSGCGCKIAPGVLEEMLKNVKQTGAFPNLLVGNESADDAAVYDLGNGDVLISTTDFFMPVVDDAFDFGRIASANALSDVYAMGGKPLMAVAILGWPIEKLSAELAGEVLRGATAICGEAGIPLAGGHTIESPEPFFGLAVTGIAKKENIKKNNAPKEGDVLFLTKPLGTGILSAAMKRGKLQPEHYSELLVSMVTLNSVGYELGALNYVSALTDITGFGLAGHLLEMLNDTDLSAEIYYEKLPKLAGVDEYIAQYIFPDNSTRIYNSCKNDVAWLGGMEFLLLCDPQTSGGLLISVEEAYEKDICTLLSNRGYYAEPVGRIISRQEKKIVIKQEV